MLFTDTIIEMFILSAHMRLLKRFLLLLAVYSLLRVGFYFYHLDLYQQFNRGEILTSFLLGIRFDLAGICLLNIPSLLLLLIPSVNSKVERSLFVIVNLIDRKSVV